MLKIKMKKKKVKDKPKKFTGNGLRIIDDDAFASSYKPAEESEDEEADELPQIAHVVDERPVEVQVMESFNQSKWKRLGSEGHQNESGMTMTHDSSPSQHDQVSKFQDFSPPRRRRNKSPEDASPPRRRRSKSSDDASPPRLRGRSQSSDGASPPRRKGRSRSPAYSPPRKAGRGRSPEDHSPARRRRESPPRARAGRRSEDASPPRRRRDSPPPRSFRKRGLDEDLPPRRRPESPPRRRGESPPRRRRESPPRRRGESPPRRRDSPPRRPQAQRRSEDSSPPRRRRESPSRLENPSLPASRTRDPSRRSDDASPPRRRHPGEYGNRSRERGSKSGGGGVAEIIDTSDNDRKSKVTLDGKKAGLQKARALHDEMIEFKKRENEMFEGLSDEVSGRNAVAVRRDRRTEEDLAKEAEKERKEAERREQYDKWGKGLKQVEEQEGRVRSALHEMSKPLARYKDDEDLDEHLKLQDRDGDPMLEYLAAKRRKAAGGVEKPKYKGPPPLPNRFNIPPGYRWDGVDRSNGYEKEWFARINARKALEEEAHKWSVEDL